jgi:hypothetical protein
MEKTPKYVEGGTRDPRNPKEEGGDRAARGARTRHHADARHG